MNEENEPKAKQFSQQDLATIEQIKKRVFDRACARSNIHQYLGSIFEKAVEDVVSIIEEIGIEAANRLLQDSSLKMGFGIHEGTEEISSISVIFHIEIPRAEKIAEFARDYREGSPFQIREEESDDILEAEDIDKI